MMDFDEYDYLEKVVEEADSKGGSTKKRESSEKREKGYRKREDDEKEAEEEFEAAERKRRKSRGAEDENRERRRDERDRRRDKEQHSHRGDKDEERDRDRDIEKRDRERDRERRDREKDREIREKDREKGREREKSKDMEKGREREKSKDREREKSKDRERDRDRDREKEREREMRSSSRSRRSSSRSRRSSSRSRRHNSREREREKELREREREIEMRDGRRFKDKKDAAEPEVDPERDQRTVFAYQMPLKAAERDVFEFFSKAGKVRDVRLIMDRNSRRSKGVGYIEFYDAMSVPMAIAMSGQLLLGQPVMVKPSEAEKNLVQSTAATGTTSVTGPYGPTDRKLYVGNLHFNMTEQQLRQIFEPFGPVELVQLPLDLETGQCKGFGFVQFAQVEHAKAAQTLNGKLEIAGRVIKVSSVTEHGVSGQNANTTAADFDDDDGGGLALNAQSRALLMQKLDRSGTASSIASTLAVPVLNGLTPAQPGLPMPMNGGQGLMPPAALPSQFLASVTAEPVGIPTECLLLKNLFDPATETDPEFHLDIKDDVQEECSNFGRVKHIYVDRNSAGHVYLRFENKEAAMQAQRSMHNRWFARRLIMAIFMPPQDYEARFPLG